VTRWYRTFCSICVTTSCCWRQWISGSVKVERQHQWGHLTQNLGSSHPHTNKEISAGTTTFLVRVKAHCQWGEPVNERVNILAYKAIQDEKVGKEWCQWMNQAVLRWQNPCCEAGKVTYQHRHLTFDNSVRDAIWREAAENTVQTNEEESETRFWRRMCDAYSKRMTQ